MWLNVIRVFFWLILSFICSLKIKIMTTYKEMGGLQACSSYNWVLASGGGPSPQISLFLPLLKLSCMLATSWKWILVRVSQPVEIHCASRIAEFYPSSYSSFLTKWRCALRNRIHLTLYLPFMSTMNRIIL